MASAIICETKDRTLGGLCNRPGRACFSSVGRHSSKTFEPFTVISMLNGMEKIALWDQYSWLRVSFFSYRLEKNHDIFRLFCLLCSKYKSLSAVFVHQTPLLSGSGHGYLIVNLNAVAFAVRDLCTDYSKHGRSLFFFFFLIIENLGNLGNKKRVLQRSTLVFI